MRSQHAIWKADLSSILSPQVLATLHYSPLTIATKLNKKHRVFHHLSKFFSPNKDNSYNTGMNMDTHRKVYPYDKFPTLTDLCELFAQARDFYPRAGRLDGGASDVRSAYNQFILQTDKCLLKVTRVESLDEPNTPLLVISLVGVFGDQGAGDVFTRAYSLPIVTLHNTLSAIKHLQTEFGSVRRRSLMYMDDLITAAPPLTVDWKTVDTSWYQQAEAIIHDPYDLKPMGTLEIHRSIIDAQTIIAKLMGKQAVKRDKLQIFIGHCVALGWVFDLRYMHAREPRTLQP